MVNKPRTYRAKQLHGDKYVEGYYFEFPATTYCFVEDYENYYEQKRKKAKEQTVIPINNVYQIKKLY